MLNWDQVFDSFIDNNMQVMTDIGCGSASVVMSDLNVPTGSKVKCIDYNLHSPKYSSRSRRSRTSALHFALRTPIE